MPTVAGIPLPSFTAAASRAPGRAISFSLGLIVGIALLGGVPPVQFHLTNGVPAVTGPTVETALVWVLVRGLVLPVLWVALGRAYLNVEK